MRLPIALPLLLSLLGAALPLAAQHGLPEGEARELMVRMCVGCHGLETVTDAGITKELWAATVDDMIAKGAKGSDEEIDIVIDYLERYVSPAPSGKPAADEQAANRSLSRP